MSRIGTLNTAPTRYATAAAFRAVNPVLLDKQQGLESDTGRTKVGDGTTRWNDLTYLTPAAVPAIKWNALFLADDTAIDGTATSVTVIFYEGTATVSLGTLLDILPGFFGTEYVGFDHSNPKTLYTPTESGPWIPADVLSGDLVFFAGINSLALGNAPSGPDGLNDWGVPATSVNLNNTFLERTMRRADVSRTGWAAITTVDHDSTGLSGEADIQGIDHVLTTIESLAATASAAVTAATDLSGVQSALTTFFDAAAALSA